MPKINRESTQAETTGACAHKQHDRPCGECPWRRASLPGWLGASEPGEFLAQSDSGLRMPCHSTVNYDSDDWQAAVKTAPQCAGHAIFLSNRCKTAAPGVLKLPADRETVFSRPHEFVAHHAGIDPKSLETTFIHELYSIKRSNAPKKAPGATRSRKVKVPATVE